MKNEIITVNLEKVIREMKLDTLYYPEKEVIIKTADINRPGLQIAGFFDYFDPNRIQVFGMVENTYLAGLSAEVRSTV